MRTHGRRRRSPAAPAASPTLADVNFILPFCECRTIDEDGAEGEHSTPNERRNALQRVLEGVWGRSPFLWFPERPQGTHRGHFRWKDAITGPVCVSVAYAPLPWCALVTSETIPIILEAAVAHRIDGTGDTAMPYRPPLLASYTSELVRNALPAQVPPDARALLTTLVRERALEGASSLWIAPASLAGTAHVATRIRAKADKDFLAFLRDRSSFYVLPSLRLEGTEQQQEAMGACLDGMRKNGVAALLGPGGSGKTWLLRSFVQQLASVEVPSWYVRAQTCPLCVKAHHLRKGRCIVCGYLTDDAPTHSLRVSCIAPTNRAVAVLRDAVACEGEGNVRFGTLHALACSESHLADVVICDESSMLAAEHGDLLLSSAYTKLAAFLFVGDHAQLPPVGAGALLPIVRRCVAMGELTHNMRAESAQVSSAVHHIRMGLPVPIIPGFVDVHQCPLDDIGDAVLQLEGVVLCIRNEEKASINRTGMMRRAPDTCRGSSLGGVWEGFVPFVGLPVRFQNNEHRSSGVFRGSLGEVVSSGSTPASGEYAIVLVFSGGRRLRLQGSLQSLCRQFVPAFAITVHDAQGGEFPRVHVVLPPRPTCPLLCREMFYTAVSRARAHCMIWCTGAPLHLLYEILSKESRPRCTPLAILAE